MGVEEHRAALGTAAYAAHAGAVAMMTSTPNVLRVAVAGRNTSGVASVMLAEAGNAITREGANVALSEDVALQGRGRVTAEGGRGVVALALTTQTAWPCSGWLVPGGHGRQAGFPASGWYVLAGQR